jgi:hypothetical protein
MWLRPLLYYYRFNISSGISYVVKCLLNILYINQKKNKMAKKHHKRMGAILDMVDTPDLRPLLKLDMMDILIPG